MIKAKDLRGNTVIGDHMIPIGLNTWLFDQGETTGTVGDPNTAEEFNAETDSN